MVEVVFACALRFKTAVLTLPLPMDAPAVAAVPPEPVPVDVLDAVVPVGFATFRALMSSCIALMVCSWPASFDVSWEFCSVSV